MKALKWEVTNPVRGGTVVLKQMLNAADGSNASHPGKQI